MPDIIKNSFFCQLGLKFITFFSESYSKSVFKVIMDNFSAVFKKSILYKIIIKYVDLKPIFSKSAMFRFIKFIGKYLGKAADRINSFFVRSYNLSFSKKFWETAKAELISDKIISAGLFFMITALSFLIFSIILGKNYENRIYISWALFFVGVLTTSAGKRLDIVKKSVAHRIIKYMVELVKM